MDPLKSAELPDGIVGCPGAAHVKLHDLIAFMRGTVLHAHGDLRAFRRPVCAKPGILERGIAQAEAEAVEGIATEVTIGAALHRIIFEWRQLVDSLIEGDWKAAGGVVDSGDG